MEIKKMKMLVLREEYLAIVKKSSEKALLLDFFVQIQERTDVFWEQVKSIQLEIADIPEGYFSYSIDKLMEMCLFNISRPTFSKIIKEFNEVGILSIKEPKNPADSRHYKLNFEVLAGLLKAAGYALPGYQTQDVQVVSAPKKKKIVAPAQVNSTYLQPAIEMSKVFKDNYEAAWDVKLECTDEKKFFIVPLATLIEKHGIEDVKSVLRFLYNKKDGNEFRSWWGKTYVKTPAQLLTIPRNSKTGMTVFQEVLQEMKRKKDYISEDLLPNWD